MTNSTIKWWHQIDLGDMITPGLKDCKEDLRQMNLPKGFFQGKSVLDVGAWDGFFSFHAEQNGASEVLAIDPYMWGGNSWGSMDGFNYARQKLNSKVKANLYPLDDFVKNSHEKWDIILFLGVFYHHEHPTHLLDGLIKLCGETIVLETMIDQDMEKLKKPVLMYYKDGVPVFKNGKKLHDPTTYWGPTTTFLNQYFEKKGMTTETRIIHGGSRCVTIARWI